MADGDTKTESDYDVLYRIMTTRMSVRRIKPDPIPDEYVEKILEAGRWAMSGANGSRGNISSSRTRRRRKSSTTPSRTPTRSSASGWSRCGLSSCATPRSR